MNDVPERDPLLVEGSAGVPATGAPDPSAAGAAPTGAAGAPDAGAAVVPRSAGWTGPERPATPLVLGASVLAGVIAAAVVPLTELGVGWVVAAFAVAALLVVIRRGTSSEGARFTADRVFWAVLALGLFGVGAVRASEWLFVLCVPTALAAASLAVVGGRTALGLFLGVHAVAIAGLRGLPWAARGLSRPGRRSGSAVPVTRAVLLSAGLLVVFGVLLTSADAAFASVVNAGLPTVDGPLMVRWTFLFLLVCIGAIGASYVFAAPPTLDAEPAPERRRTGRRIEWAMPVGVLVALFAAFVGVQLATLFGGSAYVLRTAGLTYAEYARRGFWQLLVVTVLTLVVIGVAASRAPTESAGDRRWVRGLLGGLAVLTLVIVTSALNRMWAYQEAYGFTVLRLLVEACELWLGLVYLLVIVAGVRLRAGWLPRAVVGSGAAMLLGLAILNPEGLIAERNVERFATTGRIDTEYLARLSADAVPALAALPEPVRSCALGPITERLHAESDDWREWNLARSRAGTLLPGGTIGSPSSCGSSAYGG